MNGIQQEIERLLGRSWSSYEELRGAVRLIGSTVGYFDCFEEYTPGLVTIRKNPTGCDERGFSFRVELRNVSLAA